VTQGTSLIEYFCGINDKQKVSSVCRRLKRPQLSNLLTFMQYDLRDMAAWIGSCLEGNWIGRNKYEASPMPNCTHYDTAFISPHQNRVCFKCQSVLQ